MNDVGQVWLVGQLVPLETTTLLSDILLPISLILDLLELEVSVFFDLILVNNQTLSVISLTMELLLGKGACVWLLEADESESVVSEKYAVSRQKPPEE